jgi:hypothetical protein
MRGIGLGLLTALAVAAVGAPVRAQNISINAVISGEVVPGVYGQVVLGNGPPPAVVYAQPVVAVPVAVAQPVAVQPIYLHVPPGHAKHWRQHCHEYNACNRPVYFVKSVEYQPGYRPKHEDHGHHGGDEHWDHGHHDDHGDHDRGHHDD